MAGKEREIKTIYAFVLAVFAVFLAVPIVRLLMESFVGEAGAGISNYVEVLTGRGFLRALGNSITVSVSRQSTFSPFVCGQLPPQRLTSGWTCSPFLKTPDWGWHKNAYKKTMFCR